MQNVSRIPSYLPIEQEVRDLLRQRLQVAPHFPKEGVAFADITTLLGCPDIVEQLYTSLGSLFNPNSFDIVVGIEARGFVVASIIGALATKPIGLVRDVGKLPGIENDTVYQVGTTSEYDAKPKELQPCASVFYEGVRVLLADDVVASGNTAVATAKLVQAVKGEVVGIAAIADLLYLQSERPQELDEFDLRAIIYNDVAPELPPYDSNRRKVIKLS